MTFNAVAISFINYAALHTDAVNKAVKSHERNVVLDDRPLPIFLFFCVIKPHSSIYLHIFWNFR